MSRCGLLGLAVVALVVSVGCEPVAVQAQQRSFQCGRIQLQPLLGQTWSQPPYMQQRQRARSTVRVRPSVAIKFGCFIAFTIAGMIGFVIRMTRRNGHPSPASRHMSAPGEGLHWPLQTRTPANRVSGWTPPGPAEPLRSPAPVAKPLPVQSTSGSNTLVLVVAAICSALGMLAFGLLALPWLGFRIAPVPPSRPPLPTETAESIAAQIEQSRQQIAASIDQDLPLAASSEAAPFSSRLSGQGDGDGATPPSPVLVPLAELAAPELPLHVQPWESKDLVPSGMSLTGQGMSFSETALPGGVLVGFRATKNQAGLQSVQPIYQSGQEYVLGDVYGTPADEAAQLLARPGYVVSALRVDVGFHIMGMQAAYAKLVDGRVDFQSHVTGPFFGRQSPHNSVVIEGEGDVFAGICGNIRQGIDGLFLWRVASLGPSDQTLPIISAAKIRALPRAGNRAGHAFGDQAPPGGVLVGCRFFIGRNWGGAIQGIQPVYQVGESYIVGKCYGADGGIMRQVIARPGFAVGKLNCRAGLVLNSARLTFQRVTGSGLDPSDVYESPRFGSAGGGPFVLDAENRFVVGLGGSFREDVTSLLIEVAEQ